MRTNPSPAALTFASLAVAVAVLSGAAEVGSTTKDSRSELAEREYEQRQSDLDELLSRAIWKGSVAGAEGAREAAVKWMSENRVALAAQGQASHELDALYLSEGAGAYDPAHDFALKEPSSDQESSARGLKQKLDVSLEKLRRQFAEADAASMRDAAAEWFKENESQLAEVRRREEAEAGAASEQKPPLARSPQARAATEAVLNNALIPQEIKRVAELQEEQDEVWHSLASQHDFSSENFNPEALRAAFYESTQVSSSELETLQQQISKQKQQATLEKIK